MLRILNVGGFMAQQSVDIEDNEEEKQEKLAQDNSRPFSPPSGTKDTIPKDHQSLETNIDEHEWYDEGRDGAAEVTDPRDRGVAGYKPRSYAPPKHGPVKVVRKMPKEKNP
jgi:hypothetical protein